jgi:NitT/TauT family transport system substrate-binding protein
MLTRREVLRRGAFIAAAAGAAPLLKSMAPLLTRSAVLAAPALPPPETTTIRIAHLPCDAPVMFAEYYLRQEGFTNIQLMGPAAVGDRVDIAAYFATDVISDAQDGKRTVALAGLHPGCTEIWAQPGIASVRDLRGKNVVVRSKTLGNLGYSYVAIVLKQAGIDPNEVNFVVQTDANPVALFLEGKNDAVFVATLGAVALRANPANKGHIIHNMVMDDPWAKTDCCMLVTTQDWYRAHPVAAKRAVRAIFRSADFQPADRSDAVKLVTDRGLFGGPANFANVVAVANMVPAPWRDLDAEKSIRFFATLLREVGVLRISADDAARAVDMRILRELRSELPRP